jgi:hypothetical protein
VIAPVGGSVELCCELPINSTAVMELRRRVQQNLTEYVAINGQIPDKYQQRFSTKKESGDHSVVIVKIIALQHNDTGRYSLIVEKLCEYQLTVSGQQNDEQNSSPTESDTGVKLSDTIVNFILFCCSIKVAGTFITAVAILCFCVYLRYKRSLQSRTNVEEFQQNNGHTTAEEIPLNNNRLEERPGVDCLMQGLRHPAEEGRIFAEHWSRTRDEQYPAEEVKDLEEVKVLTEMSTFSIS